MSAGLCLYLAEIACRVSGCCCMYRHPPGCPGLVLTMFRLCLPRLLQWCHQDMQSLLNQVLLYRSLGQVALIGSSTGAFGAVVSIVTTAVSVPALPAASVAVTVMVCGPSVNAGSVLSASVRCRHHCSLPDSQHHPRSQPQWLLDRSLYQ